MKKLGVALLSGGIGSRMRELGITKPKPIIPHGGMCCLTDFSINNSYLSGVQEVLIMAKFESKKIINYLQNTWPASDKFRLHYGVFNDVYTKDFDKVFEEVSPPDEKGTADAVIKNWGYLGNDKFSDIMILHSDHVYNFDYNEMLEYHRKSNAALTIGYKDIELKYVKLFGMTTFDDDNNLIELIEKPANPTSPTIFTAVAIFNKEKLAKYLSELQKTNWNYDISKDVIPAMIKNKEKIKGFHFKDYWEDIGTLERYYISNMNFLKPNPEIRFDQLPVTISKDIKRKHIIKEKTITNSIVAENAICDGIIENSIIYPGAFIAKGSVIKDSIILPDAQIKGNSKITSSIIFENHIIENKEVIDNYK